MSVPLLAMVVVLSTLAFTGTAGAAPAVAGFGIKSGSEALAGCHGTLTFTVTSRFAETKSSINCREARPRIWSLSAQAHLWPADQPNLDWVDKGCLDNCRYVEAIKRIPVQRGKVYCGSASATATTQVEQPWAGGSVKKCMRAP